MPRKRYLWIECPKCKKLTEQRIVSTKVNEDYEILRRRWCLECEHRWHTLQEPEQSTTGITEASFLRRSKKTLRNHKTRIN